MKKLILLLIRAYQRLFSPDTGLPQKLLPGLKVCRFTPTCSEYTYQAVVKYGTIKGITKGLGRILRCNPWNKGGYDPLV